MTLCFVCQKKEQEFSSSSVERGGMMMIIVGKKRVRLLWDVGVNSIKSGKVARDADILPFSRDFFVEQQQQHQSASSSLFF